MKLILFFMLTLSIWPTLGATPKVTRLMRCLGAEEKLFHQQKNVGPTYDLNQRLIGELIQINGVEASNMLAKKMCSPGSSPSLELLEAMIMEPKSWYKFKKLDKGLEANIAQELVKELNSSIPEIFLNYLAQLQGLAPNAECLIHHVPGLRELNEQVKWLQEEEELTVLTGQKKRMASIFKSVKKIDSVFEKCRQEMNQSKVKSKNNDKGAGKPSVQ